MTSPLHTANVSYILCRNGWIHKKKKNDSFDNYNMKLKLGKFQIFIHQWKIIGIGFDTILYIFSLMRKNICVHMEVFNCFT